ncbi:MAG: acetoacetate decarboxylase family protein [Proteobacteria bacterium]|nr:acetoacetate decarboxylase family protein [Pseudomonadota bacterium]
MLHGIEITTPRETLRRVRQAIKDGVKMWDGARLVLADLPLDEREVARILPWGMKPADPPLATLFITDYPKNAFTVPYKEAAVLIHVRTPLGRGIHCCWMVVDDDTALILGRENLGYPKKLADITYEESAGGARAAVRRRGVDVLTMEAVRGARQTAPPPVFARKTFNISGPGQLMFIHPVWLFHPTEVILESYEADVSVTIGDSVFDPLNRIVAGGSVRGRLTVVDILGSRYNLPVGLAGPTWVMNTYMMRFK